MANEISVTARLSLSNGGITDSLGFTHMVDMTGGDMVHLTQAVGTSAEALGLGEIAVADLGLICIVNHGTGTVSVQDGSGGDPVVDIGDGECQVFRLHAGMTPYVIADVASTVEYLLLEN